MASPDWATQIQSALPCGPATKAEIQSAVEPVLAFHLAAKDEEIERLKAIERDIRIRAEDRLERLERAEQKADANREDALANLDALEKHRRARVLANQALPAELEELAEEFDERADKERHHVEECLEEGGEGANVYGNRVDVNVAAASRLRERAAELRGGKAS